MRANFIIIDVIVNAAGATMILLFLFMVRISPNSVIEPPHYHYGSVLRIEISGFEKELREEVVAQLTNSSTVNYRIVYGKGKNLINVSPATRVLGQIGTWMEPLASDRGNIVTIVPCPANDSKWQLGFLTRLFGGEDTLPPIKLTVKIRYIGVPNGQLVGAYSVGPTIMPPTRTLTASESWILDWSIKNGVDCDRL